MTHTSISKFDNLVSQVREIGAEDLIEIIIRNVKNQGPNIKQSVKDLPPLSGEKAQSGIVISAGPSVHQKRSIHKIIDSGYQGSIIAVDGSYIACLKAGLIPDYVIILDPDWSGTRCVRWFGDHDFVKNSEKDDYFARQDLDIEFRKNSVEQNLKHIDLVNTHGNKSKAIAASCAPPNVVSRLKEAQLEIYWWNPLIDNPQEPKSVTRKIYNMNKLPSFNTGGNVGTAAWVFANSILKLPLIGMVGMDMGYYSTTPYEQTQTYYELMKFCETEDELKECFVELEFPLTNEKYYTDPTYFWYRKNTLELLKNSSSMTYNCTEGGTLFGDNLKCIYLDDFIKMTT